MKKLFALLLFLILLCSVALGEVDVQDMSFDELMKLQASIEMELKTRNINKLDFTSLRNNELEQFMVTALLELCSREDYVNDLTYSSMGKTLSRMFGDGILIIFCDTKGNWYVERLNDEPIELQFKTELEKIREEAISIPIG